MRVYQFHHTGKAIQAGLEPATDCLEGSCSIQLSYWTSVVIASSNDRNYLWYHTSGLAMLPDILAYFVL